MEHKSHVGSKAFSKSMSAVFIWSVVLLLPIKAYEVLCPDTDNPLNIQFTAPNEILVDGKIADIGRVALEYLDPRLVGCKANYDDATFENFSPAVKCYHYAPTISTCELDPRCPIQRKETLSKLRKATLKALDQVVLKIQGIQFFNGYGSAKRILFGTEPLANLTGLEIVKKAVTGKFNIVKGFAVDRYDTPSREGFNQMFSRGIELYARLSAAEEPTGLLADQKRCIQASWHPNIPPSVLHYCSIQFLTSLKGRADIDQRDIKLMTLLDETLEYIVENLSGGMKHFSGVKLPFSGHCGSNEGLAPTDPFAVLLETVETLKGL